MTGSQCMAACLLAPGTVGEGLLAAGTVSPVTLNLEHPMGILEVLIHFERDASHFKVSSAGLVRTARKLAAGEVFIPAGIWPGK